MKQADIHKLINAQEIAQLVTTIKPAKRKHSALMKALRTRYPDYDLQHIATRDGWYRNGRVIDANGNHVADSYNEWVKAEYDAMGQDARAVWTKHKDTGLIQTHWPGETLYVVAQVGGNPEDFIQIEIENSHEVTEKLVFDQWYAPSDLDDLLYNQGSKVDKKELIEHRYGIGQMINMAVFVRDLKELTHKNRLEKLPEMRQKTIHVQRIVEDDDGNMRNLPPTEEPVLKDETEWLNEPTPQERFLQDWHDSSAGRSGAVLSEHWFFETREYYCNYDKQQIMSFTPQWADTDGGMKLPKLADKPYDSIYLLMEWLERFDQKTGYPFSWYFYMLHGNRIRNDVGDIVAEGIKAAKIRLPQHDEEVLMRWHQQSYGF